jgi:hypothetical protein
MSKLSEPNWPALIGTMARAKEALSEVDDGLWPYTIPKLKATEAEVVLAERALGIAFPKSYRSFLLHANGWGAFFQAVDLLSTGELVAGQHLSYAREMMSGLRREDWSAMGVNPNKLLVIGVTLEDRDIFVLDLSRVVEQENPVIWLAGEMVDEWPSFEECFRSMIDYTLESFEEHAAKKGRPN